MSCHVFALIALPLLSLHFRHNVKMGFGPPATANDMKKVRNELLIRGQACMACRMLRAGGRVCSAVCRGQPVLVPRRQTHQEVSIALASFARDLLKCFAISERRGFGNLYRYQCFEPYNTFISLTRCVDYTYLKSAVVEVWLFLHARRARDAPLDLRLILEVSARSDASGRLSERSYRTTTWQKALMATYITRSTHGKRKSENYDEIQAELSASETEQRTGYRKLAKGSATRRKSACASTIMPTPWMS